MLLCQPQEFGRLYQFTPHATLYRLTLVGEEDVLEIHPGDTVIARLASLYKGIIQTMGPHHPESKPILLIERFLPVVSTALSHSRKHSRPRLPQNVSVLLGATWRTLWAPCTVKKSGP